MVDQTRAVLRRSGLLYVPGHTPPPIPSRLPSHPCFSTHVFPSPPRPLCHPHHATFADCACTITHASAMVFTAPLQQANLSTSLAASAEPPEAQTCPSHPSRPPLLQDRPSRCWCRSPAGVGHRALTCSSTCKLWPGPATPLGAGGRLPCSAAPPGCRFCRPARLGCRGDERAPPGRRRCRQPPPFRSCYKRAPSGSTACTPAPSRPPLRRASPSRPPPLQATCSLPPLLQATPSRQQPLHARPSRPPPLRARLQRHSRAARLARPRHRHPARAAAHSHNLSRFVTMRTCRPVEQAAGCPTPAVLFAQSPLHPIRTVK